MKNYVSFFYKTFGMNTNTHPHTEPWYFWKVVRVSLETEQSIKYLLNSYCFLGENKSYQWPEFSGRKKNQTFFFLSVTFLNNTQPYNIGFTSWEKAVRAVETVKVLDMRKEIARLLEKREESFLEKTHQEYIYILKKRQAELGCRKNIF